MKQGKKGHPHPRKEPRIPGELTLDNLKGVFRDSADFNCRTVVLGEDTVRVCYLVGMVKSERLNDYVIRPLMLAGGSGTPLGEYLETQVLYAQDVQRREKLDQAALDVISGSCALFLEGMSGCLTVPAPTEDRRGVGEPDNEPALKGCRESFTEALRVNTAMVRRHLRSPELHIQEHIVGRQSLTQVDVLWLEGIADRETVARVSRRLKEMDIDGIQSAGDLEEYLTEEVDSPFPLVAYTQRPDRFCRELLEGRVGLLCDGLPLGWMAPGTLDQFLTTGQDRAYHWMLASMLSLVRYLSIFLTLLVPGLYIALVTYHPETIPVKLALSIVAAKAQVPFSTVFEVLVLLVAFEILQEAGLRLPAPIGSTVSILGGLVVGSAAVEAKIVSPAVLIAVAIAGIAGYTAPSQDLAGALRLWRLLLAVLASLGGLAGLVLGCALLWGHLAELETFGVPYLAPFTSGAGRKRGRPTVVRPPLRDMKWRTGALRAFNRRNQR